MKKLTFVHTYNGYTYTPDGNHIRLSTNEEVPAICGNGIVEGDEVCDGTPIDCTELDVSETSLQIQGLSAVSRLAIQPATAMFLTTVPQETAATGGTKNLTQNSIVCKIFIKLEKKTKVSLILAVFFQVIVGG